MKKFILSTSIGFLSFLVSAQDISSTKIVTDNKSEALRMVVSLSIDYSKTVGQLVAKKEKGFAFLSYETDIRAADYASAPTQQVVQTEATLFRFHGHVSAEYVAEEMKKVNTRPATAVELLHFAWQYPALLFHMQVLALADSNTNGAYPVVLSPGGQYLVATTFMIEPLKTQDSRAQEMWWFLALPEKAK